MNTKHIHIENFKSIKSLDFKPRRINLFIGEPNSGKSNILEALSLLSINIAESTIFQKVFRFKTLSDLFFDFDISNPIRVTVDKFSHSLGYSQGRFQSNLIKSEYVMDAGDLDIPLGGYDVDFHGKIQSYRGSNEGIGFKAYYFTRITSFISHYHNFLLPPFGDNIPGLLISNSKLKKLVSAFLRNKGFKLNLKPVENDMAISKEVDDEIYSYPYQSISETYQRVIFMMLAIESNKDSSLIFDEPEANTFPFYTKFIAEKIALDNQNQYFISTHNPYLLSAIVEKADINDVSVFITYMKDYQTQLKEVSQNQFGEILDLSSDVFFNLEKLMD